MTASADTDVPDPIRPGLIALHGNSTEALADVLMQWMRRHPLDPLEQEAVLVQSNGTAEWFKMRMAEQLGVCAAARVELPARFAWRMYRQVLGRNTVPKASPLDKLPLTWRLMRLLPACLQDPVFAPVARFLQPGEPERLLQLAQRLADLFDQYQVYRSDWLLAWEQGEDVLLQPGSPEAQPLEESDRWQPALWRAVMADLSEEDRRVTRTALREQVLERLRTAEPGSLQLPRRVVLFGLSHVPLAILAFLDALSRHTQVVLAVPNPCRFHWADAIDGRQLLRMQRRRQPLRQGRDLAELPLESMHAHAHPLLAAWGRQSRDYVRLLDEYDSTHETAHPAHWPRIDLFDEAPAHEGTLLQQVQRSIRDLLPVVEHPRTASPETHIPASDRSIVFHAAHSLVRELEVLHDQLLELLATSAREDAVPLQPRDVIVMLPDIQQAAPSIRAVFGQYGRHDPRHIPFDIADLGARASSPMAVALQWLLRLPQQRCRLSELCDFLEVPAVAARFGLAADDIPQLTQWMTGAGIRWGLNARQRQQLGLGACGEHNSAWFGLRRMLLGYASGAVGVASDGWMEPPAWEDVEPYDEVGGLSAELAGVLAAVLDRLLRWWDEALVDAVPDVWAQRLRLLLQDLFEPQDAVEHALLDALEQSLTAWQEACDHAGFHQALPLVVAQDAWLEALDQPALEQRFRAGGVTFCTPMPMRAIPFELVCLLGMNDGDYPRRAPRVDFDLMQRPGQYRPGDRARRDQDRQLMLEAVLSARRVLYLSWTGHHARDNSEQPPSVLVSQLREYLATGWRGEQDLLRERTWHHPLQPFSRQYFEEGTPLRTYAAEWCAAHSAAPSLLAGQDALPAWAPQPDVALTVEQLTRFLRHPARAFFRERLNVHFEESDDALEDAEIFHLNGLQAYGLVQELQQQFVADWQPLHHTSASGDLVTQLLQIRLRSLQRAGRLPLAALGQHEARNLQDTLGPCLRAWQRLREDYPLPAERQRLHFVEGAVVLEDWLDQLWAPAQPTPGVLPLWTRLDPRDVQAKGKPRLDRLLPTYIRMLVASACGVEVQGMVVGRDACLHLQPIAQEEAAAHLRVLLQVWLEGQQAPLPLPWRTALQLAQEPDSPFKAAQKYEGGYLQSGEGEELAWQRTFADYEQLTADGRFDALAPRVYGPLLDWSSHCVSVQTWESDGTTGAHA